jgi:hypothetical protein
MSLLIAIVTASFFAIFGFPFLHYQCWFSWGRLSTALGSTLYFVLAGGFGGLLGWLAAQAANAQPSTEPLVNGFFYGVLGALALRADFGLARTKQAGTISSPQLFDAQSILGIGLRWTKELLDARSGRRAERWLYTLDDDALLENALRLNAHITARADIDDKAKKAMQTRLVPAMAMVRDIDPDKRLEGRTLVAQFCVNYAISEHLPKPVADRQTQTSVRATDSGIQGHRRRMPVDQPSH